MLQKSENIMSLKEYKLIKSLYELKQSLKPWNQKFDEVIISSGFKLKQFVLQTDESNNEILFASMLMTCRSFALVSNK